MKVVLIGGSPGTGKTAVSKLLGENLNCPVFAIGQVAEESGCVKSYDEERDTGIIDEDCLVEALIHILEDTDVKQVIVEGHYIDLVSSEYVFDVYILRTHPDEMKRRLCERDYSADKINENIEAEIIGVCQLDALDAFGEDFVKEIDTTNLSIDEVVKEILKTKGKRIKSKRIDWMQLLEKQGVLDQYLRS